MQFEYEKTNQKPSIVLTVAELTKTKKWWKLWQNQNPYKKTSANRRLAQAGVQAKFKVGFVFGSLVINLYTWLTKSPPDAKPLLTAVFIL